MPTAGRKSLFDSRYFFLAELLVVELRLLVELLLELEPELFLEPELDLVGMALSLPAHTTREARLPFLRDREVNNVPLLFSMNK